MLQMAILERVKKLRGRWGLWLHGRKMTEHQIYSSTIKLPELMVMVAYDWRYMYFIHIYKSLNNYSGSI